MYDKTKDNKDYLIELDNMDRISIRKKYSCIPNFIRYMNKMDTYTSNARANLYVHQLPKLTMKQRTILSIYANRL